ncbi:type II secretion system protein M [Allosphingosinicella flava]|uniref:Type II secretion system protein M n=1 Tax=Allosphingosinicella flava TaxID=2771430 RepID=A0A7T2GHL1_9SPHN|nr:type II secretion system protein GspM [Sphingosinicella flava]QPQ53998.1 type II secretion system protein M [Sphingosinicella flava]
MTTRFLDWWKGRTVREQRMLVALAVVAALVLGWLLVIRPLDAALASAKERHGQAVAALAQTRAQAKAINDLTQRPAPALGGPLATVIGTSASEAGFTVSRLDADANGNVTLAIAAARPQAFFAWVAEMESRGAIAANLTASANTDQTLSVQATFRAGGR